MSAEEDNVTHCVKGGVSEVRQQGLFLCDPNVELDKKKVRYRLGEHCIVEVDVVNREHG